MPVQMPKPIPADQLSLDTPDLYKKAINEPGSLTEKEVQTILDWVPEAVADERFLKACGRSWQELITTALEKPRELTSDEVVFIPQSRTNSYKDTSADHQRLFGKLNMPDVH